MNWSNPYNIQLAHFDQRELTVEEYTKKIQIIEAKARMGSNDVTEFYITNLRPNKGQSKNVKPTHYKQSYILWSTSKREVTSIRKYINPQGEYYSRN